ncbi:glycosyltransferase family 4 protein [Candidatus Berkelbacteria bacterium]|nr:glycosyltransferase family 4 protein [Candidatus Berkelbacteria bacterium]
MQITLVNDDAPLGKSEATRAITAWADSLQSRGHDVTVIQPDLQGVQLATSPGTYLVPAIPLPGSAGRLLSLPTHTQLEPLVARADVVHTFQPGPLGQWAHRVARANQVPAVYSTHPRHAGPHAPTLDSSLLEHAGRANLVTSPSQQFATRLRPHVATPIHPLCFPQRFGPITNQPGIMRRNLAIDDRATVALMVGPAYGGEVVQALERALGQLPDAVILGVSLGPVEPLLRRAAVLGQWGHQLRFRSAVSDDDMAALYAAASFLIASESPHPSALGEAQAAGLPTLAFMGTVAADELSPKTGIVVPAEAESVRSALCHLIDDPIHRAELGEAARSQADRFSLSSTTDRLLDLYALARRLTAA